MKKKSIEFRNYVLTMDKCMYVGVLLKMKISDIEKGFQTGWWFEFERGVIKVDQCGK